MTETALDPPLPRYHDLIGQTFSRLTVLSYAGKSGKESVWLCHCSCGTEKVIRYKCLTRGFARSCGCLRREVNRSKGHKGDYKRSAANPLWRAYQNMLTRHKAGKATVCVRWQFSFDSFVQDVGPRPDGTRLCRIERDFPFQPDNFIWKPVAQTSF